MKTRSIPKWVIATVNILFFLTPFLSLLYIAAEYFRPFIPLPIFLTIKQVFPLIICTGFAFFIFAVLVSNIRQVYKIILIIATFMLVCVSAGGVFDRKSGISPIEYLLNSVQVGNSRYNLVQIIPVGDPNSPCYIYKCDINDLGCKEISSYVGDCWSLERSELVVNPITNEINVFIDNESSDDLSLDFTYGDQPRSYLDRLELADYDYYLAYFHDYDAPDTDFNFMLYRCEKDSIYCFRLPFRYDSGNLSSSYLELDENTSEIKVFIENQLIYTYSNTPTCHVEECFLTDQ